MDLGPGLTLTSSRCCIVAIRTNFFVKNRTIFAVCAISGRGIFYNTAMAIPRFFCPVALLAGATFDLPSDAARHACRALRLGEGEKVTLFDGAGGEHAGRIVTIARDKVTVTLGDRLDVERESPLAVTLIQALQTGDKMDVTVQKAVELGVTRIVPVASRRSVLKLEGERAARRVAHWRAVAVSACEQCGRNRVPPVEEISGLERWLAQPVAPSVRRLMLAPGAASSLQALALPDGAGRVELLIGAEGGLAPEEMALAEAAGFQSVRLGPRVLRTETAGLAALAAIQALWGDLR